jgi:hypothetical protein
VYNTKNIEHANATFPYGSTELRAVLEQCTCECPAQGYEQDIRFLKACIMYADCSANGDQVFEDMSAKNIGTTHALFYIAKAVAYEVKGNYNGAARTFEEGANTNWVPHQLGATPIGKLQRGKRDFDRRMTRRVNQQPTATMMPSAPAPSGDDDDLNLRFSRRGTTF